MAQIHLYLYIPINVFFQSRCDFFFPNYKPMSLLPNVTLKNFFLLITKGSVRRKIEEIEKTPKAYKEVGQTIVES